MQESSDVGQRRETVAQWSRDAERAGGRQDKLCVKRQTQKQDEKGGSGMQRGID